MMETTRLRKFTLGAVACFAAGCASTGITVEKPGVSLRNVEVAKIDLDHQTFVLDFDVINPNPFPLPIRSVSYGVELDGFRFASGETLGEFTVPASRCRRTATAISKLPSTSI
jgi:LEA14-like dessication related protein